MTDELTEKIIGAAIEVHRILGSGLLESIDREAMKHELELRDLRVVYETDVDVRYNGIIKGLRIDPLVEGCVVIELKAVSGSPVVATAQTLSWIKATGLKHASS